MLTITIKSHTCQLLLTCSILNRDWQKIALSAVLEGKYATSLSEMTMDTFFQENKAVKKHRSWLVLNKSNVSFVFLICQIVCIVWCNYGIWTTYIFENSTVYFLHGIIHYWIQSVQAVWQYQTQVKMLFTFSY